MEIIILLIVIVAIAIILRKIKVQHENLEAKSKDIESTTEVIVVETPKPEETTVVTNEEPKVDNTINIKVKKTRAKKSTTQDNIKDLSEVAIKPPSKRRKKSSDKV